MVGVASLVYFPDLADPEQSYPEMIERFLPIGLKGIMVASLLAAFMSTLDTQMNWGASYLINDLYKPYIGKEKSRRHYVKASRYSMLLLTVIAMVVATQLSGILAIFQYMLVMQTSIAFVLIIRWYWWRINVYSEISTMVTALLVGTAFELSLPDVGDENWFAVRLVLTLFAVALVCIVTTLLTSDNKPTAQSVEFYKKMRIQGPGWKKVHQATGIAPISANFKESFIAWGLSIVALYGALFTIGYGLFSQWTVASMLLFVTVVSSLLLAKRMKNIIAMLMDIDETMANESQVSSAISSELSLNKDNNDIRLDAERQI